MNFKDCSVSLMRSYSIGHITRLVLAAASGASMNLSATGCSSSEERELIQLLAGPSPAGRVDERRFANLSNDLTIDPLVRSALSFHALGSKTPADPSGSNMARLLPLPGSWSDGLPDDDEMVEDAGLFDHDAIEPTVS